MSRVAWDDAGFARGFPHHDGFLDGVLAGDPGSDVHLALRSTGGERRILTLREVVALHVAGFREANVVLNLRVLSAERLASDPQARDLLAGRLGFEPTRLSATSRVFLLESSFGAEVIAVCGEIEISDVGVMLGWR